MTWHDPNATLQRAAYMLDQRHAAHKTEIAILIYPHALIDHGTLYGIAYPTPHNM